MIGAKRVTAPDGTTWRVGRRWLPDRPRLRRRDVDAGDGTSLDLPDLGFDDAFGLAIALVVFVLVLIFLTSIVFPVIVVTLELVILVALIVGGIVGRLVFRKPWTIRARSESGHELSWHASGFRRSGRVRDEVAAEIARGNPDVRPTELLNA